MVWGGIARGYRTTLIKCSNGVDADEYIRLLDTSGFIEALSKTERQKVVSYVERRHVCVMLAWPPTLLTSTPLK